MGIKRGEIKSTKIAKILEAGSTTTAKIVVQPFFPVRIIHFSFSRVTEDLKIEIKTNALVRKIILQLLLINNY